MVPTHWVPTTLGDLVDEERILAQNGFPQGEHNQKGQGVVHLRPFNVSEDGTLTLSAVKYVSEPPPESPYWVEKGDIIFNNTNSEEWVGKTAYFDFEGAFVLSNHMTIVRVLDPKAIHAQWLARHLHYLWLLGEFRRLCRRHVNQASVGVERFKSVELSLPPLSEQRAIADALEAVHKAKEARRCELTLERERKAALMEYLFTHGTRSEPTKQTEIGEIPESWHLTQLGEIARIGNGSTPKRSDERYWKGGTISWITSTQIHDVVIEHANEFVTETARKECHLPLVPSGSIVVAITGQGKTLGNASILAIDTCINQHLAYIRLERASIHPKFVLVYLHSKYSYLRGVALAGGSTKGALTCGFLKSMSIPVPPLDEQIAISEQLIGCQRKCTCLDGEIAVLEELFRALLEELMTGRLSATALIEEHQPR
jgi:type I restriction enzyme, S subunit